MMDTSERAVCELDGGSRIAVRVDGVWLPNLMMYTEELPVFSDDDGTEVDVREDGTILYETPGGAVQEIEPHVDEGGVATYLPHRIYPAGSIEVHDITESQA